MLKRILVGIFLMVCLTAFTNFSKEADSQREDVKGNPDPNVGIVFSLYDTANDIMKASSDNIRFQAMIVDDKTPILSLGVPIDFKPKKITFVNEMLGFTAEVFRPFFHFNFEEGKLTSAYFYPFDPGQWRTKEETQPYLDKWVKLLDETGWVREYPDEETYWWWQPLQFPTKENHYRNNYMVWESPDAKYPYQIVMLLKMADPRIYGRRGYSEPMYNVQFRLERDINKINKQ